MHRIFVFILFGLFCCVASKAQSTRKIRELEKQQAELKKQIAQSESLLSSTKKDVKSQLNNLALISGQIDERKKYLSAIETDVQTMQGEIERLQTELGHLRRDLADKKQKYEKSVTYMYRNKSIQEKLMFIFSADNLSRMYRRLRYVQEYADYQRSQGLEVERKQKQVAEKRQTLVESREAKRKLLEQGEVEKQKLETQEKERQALLSSLQKRQRSIQSEIRKKRRSADQLDAQIDRLIAIEIEKARQRAEEERRRAAEEKHLAENRKTKKTEKKHTDGSKVVASEKKSSVSQMERYRTDSEDRRLSGVFEQNKGRLPMPITGAYVIIGHYGQYQVSGLRNVRLDNKGIDIKGQRGAKARAIFDGEVSAIFQYNGLSNVLVRHGSYISVYCNLSSVSIHKGSRLKTGDIIGQVHTDADGNTILHFQLRKEIAKLNPEVWLR